MALFIFISSILILFFGKRSKVYAYGGGRGRLRVETGKTGASTALPAACCIGVVNRPGAKFMQT